MGAREANGTDDASPLQTYLGYCQRGVLAYQVGVSSGEPVFYPRLFGPETGEALEWAESAGLGTVYAATTVHQRNAPSYNVVLVDLDEGFRMMSRVDGVATDDVRIGLRVRAQMVPADDEHPAHPVFRPVSETS